MNKNEKIPMFDEREYTAKEASFIEHKEPLAAADLRCIDDREGRRGAELPPYAVPGSGLGAVMDVVAAVYKIAAEEGDPSKLDIKKLFAAGKESLGGTITFHTDTVHEGFACAGCGYCAASLKNPEENYFPDSTIDYIKYEVLDQCQKDMAERGMDVPTYSGPHVAKAVVVVDTDNISLNSTGAGGDHVYVYHPKVRNELLKTIAKRVYDQVKIAVPKLHEKEWIDEVIAIADKRLENVMKNLGADKLPMFVVAEKDSAIIVQPFQAASETGEPEEAALAA